MTYDGRPCAVFTFGDTIREGASPTVKALQEKGHRVVLISGDSDATTQTVARQLGMDGACGGQLPQEKAAFIQTLREEGGFAAMVGDGVNDAPALLRADLAVAVHSGAPLGQETGHITLMRGEPLQLLSFLALSDRVNKKVTQNLVFSFLYNGISIPIAMSGLLNPLIAVCAMLLSSLTVIGNTLLLTRAKAKMSSYGSSYAIGLK
jgi:P-type E1-E2 ATPase